MFPSSMFINPISLNFKFLKGRGLIQPYFGIREPQIVTPTKKWKFTEWTFPNLVFPKILQ